MDNLPRFFFYLSGILIVTVAFTLFTSELLVLINNGTALGTILFFVFGLIYMNIVVITSRRFMRRLDGPTIAPYLFAIITFLPPSVWVYLYQGGANASPLLYVMMLLIACGTGAYFGHRLGIKAQIQFQDDLKKHFEQEERLRSDSPQTNTKPTEN